MVWFLFDFFIVVVVLVLFWGGFLRFLSPYCGTGHAFTKIFVYEECIQSKFHFIFNCCIKHFDNSGVRELLQ